MNLLPTVASVYTGNWNSVIAFNRDTQRAIQKIGVLLGIESSPTFAGLSVGDVDITSTSVGYWNTAYGWGDHAGLYDDAGTAVAEVGDHESTYDHTKLHDPVTIPVSPNGLSLTGQEISLPTTAAPQLASLTVDTDTISIDATNHRLGVGEAAPDYKLDVNGAIGFTPGASVTPVDNGDVVIEATNNTTLTFKLKGSDGTVRTGTLTLS